MRGRQTKREAREEQEGKGGAWIKRGKEAEEERRRERSKSQERQESELCTCRTADRGKAPSDRWWRNCFGNRGRLLLWRKLAIAVVILLLKTLIKTVSNSKDSIFSLAIRLGWSNQGNMKPGWMVYTWIPSTSGRGESRRIWNLRSFSAIQWIQGQPALYERVFKQKQTNKAK